MTDIAVWNLWDEWKSGYVGGVVLSLGWKIQTNMKGRMAGRSLVKDR